MIIKETNIEGSYLIISKTHLDNRGYFREIFRKSILEEKAGYQINLEQGNISESKKNVLRGIHTAPWSKLIYCINGMVQSVTVDLRQESKTFKKYFSITMSDENGIGLFIPAGIGNSYLALTDNVKYLYLTDKEYAPNKEIGILWNDPTLKIEWQIKGMPLVSDKDKDNPLLEAILRK